MGTVLCIPANLLKWYFHAAANNVSHILTLGDRGRFVIPIEVRDRHGWDTGASLIAVDTDAGDTAHEQAPGGDPRWVCERGSDPG